MERRCGTLLAVLMFAGCASAPSPVLPVDSPADREEKAQALLAVVNRGVLGRASQEEARTAAEQVTSEYPETASGARAFMVLADAMEEDEPQVAYDTWVRFLEFHPRNPRAYLAHHALAALSLRLGRQNDADAWIRRAIDHPAAVGEFRHFAEECRQRARTHGNWRWSATWIQRAIDRAADAFTPDPAYTDDIMARLALHSLYEDVGQTELANSVLEPFAEEAKDTPDGGRRQLLEMWSDRR